MEEKWWPGDGGGEGRSGEGGGGSGRRREGGAVNQSIRIAVTLFKRQGRGGVRGGGGGKGRRRRRTEKGKKKAGRKANDDLLIATF